MKYRLLLPVLIVLPALAGAQLKIPIKKIPTMNFDPSKIPAAQKLTVQLPMTLGYGDPCFIVDKGLLQLTPYLKGQNGIAYSVADYLQNDGDMTISPSGQVSGRFPRNFWVLMPAVPAGRYTLFFADPDTGAINPATFQINVTPKFGVSAPATIDEGGTGYVGVYAAADAYLPGLIGPLMPLNATTLAPIPGGQPVHIPIPTFTISVDKPTTLQLGQVTQANANAGATIKAVGIGSATLTVSSSDPSIPVFKKLIQINERPRPMPIVFVPGTAGSELIFTRDNRRFWLGSETLETTALSRATFEPMKATQPVQTFNLQVAQSILNVISPVLPSVPGTIATDVYQGWENWAKATFKNIGYYPAPYDWRHGAGPDSAAAIDAVVKRALQEHPGSTKVILVAHSLGGIVARNYIKTLGQGKVGALIAVGTPWLGAPKTARALTWGYNFDVGMFLTSGVGVDVNANGAKTQMTWFPRISMLSLAGGKTAAAQWECVYQMLPTANYQALLGKLLNDPSQSLMYKTAPAQAQAILRQANPAMYDAQLQTMSTLLDGNDYSANYYLISGFTHHDNSNPDHEGSMDVQLTLPNQVAGPSGNVATVKWNSIGGALGNISLVSSISPGLDRFVASVTNNDYGDGTSPILSATLGQWLDANHANTTGFPTADKTKSLLGSVWLDIINPTGKVFVYKPVDLGAEGQNEFLNHGSMLRAKPVQDDIVNSYYRRTQLPVTAATMPNVVSDIQVEIDADGLLGATCNAVKGAVPGCTIFDGLCGLVGEHYHDVPCPFNSLTGLRMYEEDLNGATITLTNGLTTNLGDWKIKHIRVRVNGAIWLDNNSVADMTSQHPTSTFTLHKP